MRHESWACTAIGCAAVAIISLLVASRGSDPPSDSRHSAERNGDSKSVSATIESDPGVSASGGRVPVPGRRDDGSAGTEEAKTPPPGQASSGGQRLDPISHYSNQLGEEYRAAVLEALYSQNPAQLTAVLTSLSWDLVGPHRDRILELLSHPSLSVRAGAVSACRFFLHDPAAREALLELWTREPDPLVYAAVPSIWTGGVAGQQMDADWTLSVGFMQTLWKLGPDPGHRWVVLDAFASLEYAYPPSAIAALREMVGGGYPDGPQPTSMTSSTLIEDIDSILSHGQLEEHRPIRGGH